MEIVVILVAVGVALWWFAFRKKPESVISTPAAPYKVETPAPVGKPADEIVEATAPESAPAKTTTAKAKAPAKPKAPAKAKAPKAKAPAKPKAKTKPVA